MLPLEGLIYKMPEQIFINLILGAYIKSCEGDLILVHISQIISLYMKLKLNCIRLEVPTAITMKTADFWELMLCCLRDRYEHLPHPGHGDRRLLQNVGPYSPNHMMLYPNIINKIQTGYLLNIYL
jgi:hypothetical protein